MGGVRRSGSVRAGAAVALLALTVAGSTTAQELVPLGDGRWDTAGDVAAGTVDGRPALNLRIGAIERQGLTLGDGTVEFDVLTTTGRTFVGIRLRAQEDGTYEDLYLRPHKSGLPDAVQYTPSYRGIGQWQLHHDAEATAFAHYTPGVWQHVRVELRGAQAALFLGDGAEPVLVVNRMRTGASSGGFGFWANQPGATASDPWTVSISNLRVQPGVTTYDFPAPPPLERAAGVIERWEVSAAGSGSAADLDALPTGLAEAEWRTVEADPSGLVELQRAFPRPAEGAALAFARLRLRADRARRVRLDLGFSDDATVFLDGRPVYSGRFGYSYNFPREDGLITIDRCTVHLDLAAGAHEVVVAVSDVFGGWGLMGRILDRAEIQVVRP